MPCQSRCLASYATIYYYNAILFYVCFLPNFQCNVIFHSFFPFFIYSSLSFCSFFFWTSLICQFSHESFELGVVYLVFILYGQFFSLSFHFQPCCVPITYEKIVPFFTSLETLNSRSQHSSIVNIIITLLVEYNGDLRL